MTKFKIEQLQETFKSEVEKLQEKTNQLIKEAFEAGVTSSIVEDREVSPKFKTVKRRAEVGERVLVSPGGWEPKAFTVSYVSGHGSVDVEEIEELNHRFRFAEEEYEVIIKEAVPLTANQQRAELIQSAKKFVEDKFFEGNYDVGNVIDGFNGHNKVEFIVNKKKRTVVALLRFSYVEKIISRGFAKCMPGDVFNADIGKAIALARALNIEIPEEFLHAVQPTEVVVGMVVVKYSDANIGIHQTVKRLDGISNFSGVPETNFWTKECWGSLVPSQVNILDDTNAVYSDDTQ